MPITRSDNSVHILFCEMRRPNSIYDNMAGRSDRSALPAFVSFVREDNEH